MSIHSGTRWLNNVFDVFVLEVPMENAADTGGETPPFWQDLFDRPFLLLTAGLLVMFVFYTGWGMVEILNLPPSQLP